MSPPGGLSPQSCQSSYQSNAPHHDLLPRFTPEIMNEAIRSRVIFSHSPMVQSNLSDPGTVYIMLLKVQNY